MSPTVKVNSPTNIPVLSQSTESHIYASMQNVLPFSYIGDPYILKCRYRSIDILLVSKSWKAIQLSLILRTPIEPESNSLYSENLGDDPTNNDSNKSTTLLNDNISGFEFISKTIHHGWSDSVRVTYMC